jgi:hypothetical protein
MLPNSDHGPSAGRWTTFSAINRRLPAMTGTAFRRAVAALTVWGVVATACTSSAGTTTTPPTPTASSSTSSTTAASPPGTAGLRKDPRLPV